jgi:hypothetical protein
MGLVGIGELARPTQPTRRFRTAPFNSFFDSFNRFRQAFSA